MPLGGETSDYPLGDSKHQVSTVGESRPANAAQAPAAKYLRYVVDEACRREHISKDLAARASVFSDSISNNLGNGTKCSTWVKKDKISFPPKGSAASVDFTDFLPSGLRETYLNMNTILLLNKERPKKPTKCFAG